MCRTQQYLPTEANSLPPNHMEFIGPVWQTSYGMPRPDIIHQQYIISIFRRKQRSTLNQNSERTQMENLPRASWLCESPETDSMKADPSPKPLEPSSQATFSTNRTAPSIPEKYTHDWIFCSPKSNAAESSPANWGSGGAGGGASPPVPPLSPTEVRARTQRVVWREETEEEGRRNFEAGGLLTVDLGRKRGLEERERGFERTTEAAISH